MTSEELTAESILGSLAASVGGLGQAADLDAHPVGTVVLSGTDGTHTGLGVSLLYARIVEPALSGLTDAQADQAGRISERALSWVLAAADYEEVLGSLVETITSMCFHAFGTDGLVPSETNPDPGPHLKAVYYGGASQMLDMARAFERAHDRHAATCFGCPVCLRDTPDFLTPARIRARFCREMMEHFIDGPGDSVTVTGLPLRAALDVACLLVDISQPLVEMSSLDYVQMLRECVSHSQTHRPDPGSTP